jgi:hypothetical protein
MNKPETRQIRMGRIILPEWQIIEKPELLCIMFSEIKFAPLKINHIYGCKTVIYYGVCPLFNSIQWGTEIPGYRIISDADLRYIVTPDDRQIPNDSGWYI